MALPQVILQYIKKSFEVLHWVAKIYWIPPASLWNSTTVITPVYVSLHFTSTNYYSWTHWCLGESFVCSEWNTRSKPTEEGSKLEIMPRFLAITVANPILEVHMAIHRRDGKKYPAPISRVILSYERDFLFFFT